MKFPPLDSIAGRTLIVLLVGLTLSHIASTALLSLDRRAAVGAAAEQVCVERAAVLARLLDHSAADRRAALAAELASPTLHVAIAAAPAVAPRHRDSRALGLVAAAFRPYFGTVADPRLHVVYRTIVASPRSMPRAILEGFPGDRVMEISFRLSDGAWANFKLAMAGAATLWSPHAVASTLVMLTGIIVLGGWATGWVGRPLAAFARAADRLGRDVNAPPLPSNGPPEVRHAATAFNDMQTRIRRFVEDRTRMLAAISHDLRSPITRMRLRAEMMPGDEVRARMLADLDEMEVMVASTLEFARGEAADEPTQSIDLAATLATICDNASDLGLAAAYVWERRELCHCRPMAMKRALTNLVENAARYGGRARVFTHHHKSGLDVIIEDEGPGIPEAEMEAVFAPFHRLEESRNRKTGGVGLGMTVARTIVRSHGGDIRLENRSEGGLRVVVTLPREVSA